MIHWFGKRQKHQILRLTLGAFLLSAPFAVVTGAGAYAASKPKPTENASDKVSGDVIKVRLGGDQQSTRIVIELDQDTAGNLLSSPTDRDEITIELDDVNIEKTVSGNGQGLIKTWRLENAGGSVRLRINLSAAGKIHRRFLLPPADGISAYRYVVDIVPAKADTTIKSTDPAPTYLARETKAPEPQIQAKRKKVIVIDAGHGGHDPGALGDHSREKDVNLAAALALKANLEKTGRYTVIMTRETDVYVDLPTRVKIARNANADLFISLHSDSGDDESVRGATIYTLSEAGTERAAKKALVKGDWSLADTSNDRVVNRILIDLSQRATKNRSAIFAQLVMDNISGSTPLTKSSLRQAGFMVLLAPDVPAVLLEMGFMTNDDDEAMLNDSRQRNTMMANVARAIDQYFSSDVRYASFAGVN